jgi:hypothetical protein
MKPQTRVCFAQNDARAEITLTAQTRAHCRVRAACVPCAYRPQTGAHQSPVQPMREPRPESPAASTHHRQQETWRRPPLPCVSSCSRRVAPQRVDWAASVSRHRLGGEQVLARPCRPGVNLSSTSPSTVDAASAASGAAPLICPHLPPSKADAGCREACHALATSFAGQFHLFEARRYTWCVLSGRAQL